MIRWKGRPELYIIEAEEGGRTNGSHEKGMAAALVTAEVLFLLLLSVLAAILNLFIF